MVWFDMIWLLAVATANATDDDGDSRTLSMDTHNLTVYINHAQTL